MNKLRNGLLIAAAVGAGGTGTYLKATHQTTEEKVAKAQEQIVREAKYDKTHPADDNESLYNAGTTAEDAKAIATAKKLTANRIAKLSFDKAFTEATKVGGLVIDVADMTSSSAEDVLKATLPESSLDALESRNIHFLYNSTECNPYTYSWETSGHKVNFESQGGYIPVSFGDTAPPAQAIHTVNPVNSGKDSAGHTVFFRD
ncbi:MAG: hypothetical protein AAB462_04190 [Patescibacteria group bacterium]